MSRLKLALAAGVVAAGAATQVAGADSAAPRAAAAAQGGLSVTPGILERTARNGASGTVTITNTSGRRLRVTVRPRPWRQARSGVVAANRRRTLGRRVGVSARRFRLASGASRTVTVTLRRRPARRSLYGSLDVTGKPTKRRAGINVGYRIISSLRFNPPAGARRLRLRAGGARSAGRGRNRALVLKVRNRGNTIDPVGGTVHVRGARGGRSAQIAATRILPGKLVNLRLVSLRGLPRGAYRAAVTLTQGGANQLSATRRFRVR